MALGAQLSSGDEARAFAESVAGVLERSGWAAPAWAPGGVSDEPPSTVARALEELGWSALASEPGLVACAGLAGVELGRRLGPLATVDGLLGGAPVWPGLPGTAPATGDLVRTLTADPAALCMADGSLVRRAVLRAEPLASTDGLQVHRLLELGEAEPVDAAGWPVALGAWLAANVGYLAGIGQGALDLTVEYVRQRRAFGGTLAALAPVQQLLAGAATGVRGVRLLAGEAPGADALAHAGEAIAGACAACHQVSGAIGYTLEHPLHRYSQRARALATWNEALESLLGWIK